MKKKANLKKRLDKIWSEIVKRKAGYKCEYCGKVDYLNSHHVFSRSNHAVRWEVENGCCLCSGHHMLCTFSAHKSPLEFAEWMIKTRGRKWYDQLRIKSKKVVKIDQKKLLKKLCESLRYITQNMEF